MDRGFTTKVIDDISNRELFAPKFRNFYFSSFFSVSRQMAVAAVSQKKINSSEQKKVTLIFSPNSLND